jgi:hypothetical protein
VLLEFPVHNKQTKSNKLNSEIVLRCTTNRTCLAPSCFNFDLIINMPFCGPKIRVEVLLTASQQFHLDSRYYSLYIMPHNNKMQRSKYLLIRKLRIRLTWKKTEKKNRISNYSFSPTCISANILQVSLRGTTDSHYLKKPSQDYRSPRHYDRRTVGQPLSPFWCQAHNQIFVLVS